MIINAGSLLERADPFRSNAPCQPFGPVLPAGAYNYFYTGCLIIYSYEVQSLTLCPRDKYVPAVNK